MSKILSEEQGDTTMANADMFSLVFWILVGICGIATLIAVIGILRMMLTNSLSNTPEYDDPDEQECEDDEDEEWLDDEDEEDDEDFDSQFDKAPRIYLELTPAGIEMDDEEPMTEFTVAHVRMLNAMANDVELFMREQDEECARYLMERAAA